MYRLYQLFSLFLLGASAAGFPAYLRQLNAGFNRWAISFAIVSALCLVIAALADEFLAHFLNQPKGIVWGWILVVFGSLVCGFVMQGG